MSNFFLLKKKILLFHVSRILIIARVLIDDRNREKKNVDIEFECEIIEIDEIDYFDNFQIKLR